MAEPAFAVIADAVRSEIVAGVWAVGASLPTERELAERFGVSVGTVRVALRQLVVEGTVDGVRGRPKTVVRPPQPPGSFGQFRSLAQWAWQHGLRPGGHLVAKRWHIASDADVDLLAVDDGSRVLEVTRLRTLDGERVMLERSRYVDWLGELVAALGDDAPSVTALLEEQHGVRFSHAEHLFGAEAARQEDAEVLGVEAGTPLLVHRRLSRDATGRPLEWSLDRYVAGRVMLSAGTSWHSSPLRWVLPPGP
ncbi:GntR family transcriptional regulator [Pseudokineococcus sp. 1T1Z-3]|uniref:GntR family transcriptional regulator n=1 Tax=Pseudokineococcus sp. 1T1Z-3 TaxID=3132745 RepID=UPI0030A73A72